jgi:hypothetical protein
VTQGDSTRRLVITLQNKGRPFPLPKKWTAVLTGIKPDEKILYNSCMVDYTGKIIYDFAGGEEIATAEGDYEIQFEIFDEVGDTVATPAMWLSVKKSRIHDVASFDQFTAAKELLGRVNQTEDRVETLEESSEKMKQDLSNLLPLASTIGEIDIPAAAWSWNYPAEAKIRLPDIGENTVVFLVPANDITRAEATNAGLAVKMSKLDSETEKDSIVVVSRSEKPPAHDLTFTCLALRGAGEEDEHGDTSYKPSVSLVGIGSGGNLGLVIKNGMICQKYKIP